MKVSKWNNMMKKEQFQENVCKAAIWLKNCFLSGKIKKMFYTENV